MIKILSLCLQCSNEWLVIKTSTPADNGYLSNCEIGLFLCPSVTAFRCAASCTNHIMKLHEYSDILLRLSFPNKLFQRFGGVESFVRATGLVAVLFFLPYCSNE